MLEIIAIVEGHGDAEALPILIRRIAEEVIPGAPLRIHPPIRVRRQQVVQPDKLERTIQVASARSGRNAGILVLLDANGDCPAVLGPELLRRAQAARTDRLIKVVLANAEYEAWFLAGMRSIAGRHRIGSGIVPPQAPEAIRNAKGWLSKRMPRGKPYKPMPDQAALTRILDLGAARTAPSFDKFWRDVGELLLASKPA